YEETITSCEIVALSYETLFGHDDLAVHTQWEPRRDEPLSFYFPCVGGGFAELFDAISRKIGDAKDDDRHEFALRTGNGIAVEEELERDAKRHRRSKNLAKVSDVQLF